MRQLMLGVVIGFVLSGLVLLVPLVRAQSAPPLQEFIPLPGPGQQQPGQGPAPQQGQDECQTILFFYNGQLYRLMPGPGPQNGPGQPGSPPEFFRLDPYRGPAIPGLPQPFPQRPDSPGPNFLPALPRS
jgi:hypothetical protein